MERIWLKNYPPGMPTDIDTSQYASLVALLEESFAKYRDRKAFICMDKAISFGELDAMSRDFAAYLQGTGLKFGDRVAIMHSGRIVALDRPATLLAALGDQMLDVRVDTDPTAALAKLREVGPCSQNQLGRLIYLDAATTKGVVDRLEARGLVTARPDARDRRRRAIALTEKGRAAADAAVKVARQITRQTLVPLTAAEQRAVIGLLRKLT